MSGAAKREQLAGRLRRGEFILAPGVFEMISAKIADRAGFDALYMTGYGIAASHLGLPDAGLASFADVLERVRILASGTSTPLICDADTGFGGLLNVRHTVRSFEDAGCAAIQIEDQRTPKKCGYTSGIRVVEIESMLRKVEVALEARADPNLLIIARTDARAALGLDEAIRRAQAYARTGADIVFIQGPESVDELTRIGAEIAAPVLVNLGHGGKTPVLPAAQLEALGFNVAIYPGVPMLAAAATLESVYETIKRDGGSQDLSLSRWELEKMHRLMGLDEIAKLEESWPPAPDESA